MRRLITVVLALVCFCPKAWAVTDKGLVAYYSFDKVAGSVVSDESGSGNNGKINGGVKQVSGSFGSALRFDGKNGFVDCGSDKSLNIGKAGSFFFWFKPEATCQGGLVSWTPGTGMPNQRLIVSLNTVLENRGGRGGREYKELGLYISDGENPDRPFASNFHEPYFPPADKWLCYAVSFDGRQLDIYQDGILLYSRFQSLVPDTEDVPLWLGRCFGTGGPSDYFAGLMDEVRIYNRPLSEQEVYQLYLQTAAGRDQKTAFNSIAIKPIACPKPGTIFADLDYRGLVPTDKNLLLKAELLDAKGKAIAVGKVKMLPAWGRAEAVFDVQTQPAGSYTVRASADKGKPATVDISYPGREKGWEKVKVLNNFCWELLNESPGNNPKKEYAFTNPRRGWVYLTAEADGDITLSLAKAKPPVLYAPGKGASQEAMRWMEQGQHAITVSGSGAVKKLVVRSVPILIFCHYPHVGPGTGTDHDFLVKYVLPHVNTMITGDYGPQYNPDNFRARWVDEMGRQCIQELYTRSLLQPELKDATAKQQIYDHMAKAAGMNKTDFAGVILDEFDPGDDAMAWYKSYYDEWMEDAQKILTDPKFSGRMVIPWFGYNMFDFQKSSAFLRTIIKYGSYLADEIYVDERDTESRESVYMNEAMADLQDDWERAVPGATERMIITPSYLAREYWNPAVDFKVYMDMQFEHLATRPEFFGLAGVGEYQSHSSTEEYVRFAANLCRHYGLEGQTSRLSKDSYNLTHIRNADFLEGTEGWKVKPAEKDSMAVKSYKGYGLLQDRYPYRPWTDTTFLWTRRSKDKPNLFSQEIRDLKPGRLYLVRLWIGDYVELITGDSKNQERAVTLRVDNGDPWNNWYRTQLMKGSVYTSAGYQMQPFSYQNQYYFKVHHLVFRAKGPTATLSISDWKDEKEPGGPIGQELIFNRIEVEPYLEYPE